MIIFGKYFIYFMIYSFLGWIKEVIEKLFELRRFINRGFLIGPICPIYGYGVLGIILLVSNNTNDLLAVFLKCILICSVLEYFTSYIMEKLFKSRWWDYSRWKFNINGRICLETMIPFGIFGTIIIYFVHPFIVNLVDKLSDVNILVISIILLIIHIIDISVSFKVMSKIKKEIKKQSIDNTEVIRKKVLLWLGSNSILYRRFKESYPKFRIYEKMLKFKNNNYKE